MNTPKTPEPSDEAVIAVAKQHGIDCDRLRFITGGEGGDGGSDERPGGNASLRSSTAALLTDYRDLTDVRLRSSMEAAHGLYIAESTKIITRALAAGHIPRSFFMSRLWFLRLAETLGGAWASAAPILLGTEAQVDGVVRYHLHRGGLASMQRPAPLSVAAAVDGAHRVVVVEDVVDHTNLGAIFRSAAGLGVDAILLSPSCADPLYRRSIRVSMGTVFQVPWARLSAWPKGLRVLKEDGFTIAALALEDDSVPLREFAADAPDRVAMVMGTEGDGLKRATLAETDTAVLIPMTHGVDSLNVAAATAVASYALQIVEDPADADGFGSGVPHRTS
ncbi:TrmH family RNA methyltransferase [Brevibacterium yomogidense]|uniref:TrmH family RNA methyltransferase n=1 Tax=Brevibacterium yomogidense TaxID=946573 RepID=UPI002FCD5A57